MSSDTNNGRANPFFQREKVCENVTKVYILFNLSKGGDHTIHQGISMVVESGHIMVSSTMIRYVEFFSR